MVILLTGATGFLGSHLMRRMLDDGHLVYVVTRRSVGYINASLIEIIGNFVDGWPVDRIPWHQLDAVIHLAAGGVKSARREWHDSLQVNIMGTYRLINAIDRYAVKKPRVIIARTFYEHFLPQIADFRDNPYIATKAAASEMVRIWSERYEGSIAMATVFHIYGPGDDPGSVLSYAAKQLLQGNTAQFSSGQAQRDWLFVDDAIDAFIALLSINDTGLSEWDIGSGQLVSIREIVLKLAEIANAQATQLEFDSKRDRSDVGVTLSAKRFPTDWLPKISMETGLRRLLYASLPQAAIL